jgi:FtsH-binding integral membrane protein
MIMMVLAYNDAARRTYPYNYITLFFFTLSFAFLVGSITSTFSTYLLLEAVGLTAITVGFLFVLATVTDFDFTRTGALSHAEAQTNIICKLQVASTIGKPCG